MDLLVLRITPKGMLPMSPFGMLSGNFHCACTPPSHTPRETSHCCGPGDSNFDRCCQHFLCIRYSDITVWTGFKVTFALLHFDKRPHRSSPNAWLHRKSLNNCPLCSLIFPGCTESEPPSPLLKPHHQIFLISPSDTARSYAYEWVKMHNISIWQEEMSL